MLPLKDAHARKQSDDALEAARLNSQRISEQEAALQQARQEIAGLDQKAGQLSRSNAELSEHTRLVLESVRQLREELDEEMQSLKLSRNRLLPAVTQKMEQEMQELLATLRRDHDSYLSLNKEMAQLSSRISLLNQEIDKFKAISSSIKAMDFEMKRYARALDDKENEKLRLIRRIEELQSIISRERRIRTGGMPRAPR